jgi:diacylglycerol kinase (ATP)
MLRLYKAFFYSIDGLAAAFKHEAAFRLEVYLAIILIPLVFFFELLAFERVLLISTVLLVLVIELINSAIEAAIDRISEEKHELSKRAKDVGSAAVLVSVINAVVVWIVILFSL